MTPDAQRLLQELKIHQIELEMQNEALVRTQAELEDSLACYTELYEFAPVGYLTLDRNGGIRRINTTGERLLGCERSRLIGQRLRRFFAAEDGARFDGFFAQLLAGRSLGPGALSLRSDGVAEAVELAGAAVDQGRECRIVMNDITARHRAEGAQRVSERRFRVFFEMSPDALLTLVAPSFGFASANATAVAMFGARDEADLLSRFLWDYAPEIQPDGRSSVDCAREMIDAAMRHGVQHFEWTQRRAPGADFPASVRLSRAESAGEVLLLANVRDETEARDLLATVAQSERLVSVGMLAAGVAHEINNSLTSVLYDVESLSDDLPELAGAVQRCCAALRALAGNDAVAKIAGDSARLLEGAALEDLSERLREAGRGTHRIRDVAAGLGAFSRVEHVAPSGADLNQAVQSAVNMATNEIRFRARLIKDLTKVPEVRASEGKLIQVFLNLLINAAHAIDEGDSEQNCITIRTWGDGDMAYAEFADTGKGISAATLPHIFEPFFSTKRLGKGSGLGLAICRSIVSGFGGEISVSSAVGRGTRFVVRLPVTAAATEARRHTPIPDSAVAAGVRGRILVVDDEEVLRNILARVLGDAHDVITAGSVAEGQAILQRDPSFDLILCDVMMPGLTGMDLHEWLASQHPLLAPRVIFMTGGAFTPRASDYLGRVTNLQVGKPFDFAALRKVIAKGVLAVRTNPLPGGVLSRLR
ncbi:MAG: PAS domain S-box protein [Polyangiaceae bacterium]|nr:PAS domain S-box protein [Polyangiaceae bacterium]